MCWQSVLYATMLRFGPTPAGTGRPRSRRTFGWPLSGYVKLTGRLTRRLARAAIRTRG